MSYNIWVFTQAGAKAAYLENAFNISRSGKMNQTLTLSLSLPADDAKAAFLTSAYEVKAWNTIKDRWEGLFRLEMMRTSAHGRFLEAAEFFKTYSQYQHLENLPPEEIAKLEKAQWETKSMYYPELGQRYNLTPQGIQMFPHETSIPRHQIGGSRK